jgi:hypothetical protein
MLHFRQWAALRIRRTQCRGGKRWIFGIDPLQ